MPMHNLSLLFSGEMEPTTVSSSNGQPSTSTSTSRRLLFDRRYGWVFDEWKDPSQVSLAGGRGMFCVVPLAISLSRLASESINLAATSAVKVYENPDLLSPRRLQATLGNQIEKFNSFRFPNYLAFKGSSASAVVDDQMHSDLTNAES